MALPVATPEPEPHPSEAARWRAEWSRYGRRYGVPPAPQVERLESRAQANRVRLGRIEEELAALEAEKRRLTQELAAWEKAIALTLGTEVARLRARYGEAWSPTPVPGYRVWQLVDGVLRGARVPWKGPWMRAMCAHGGHPDEVPHSDGRCGRLGCGIYAAKHPDLLARELTMDWEGALGLVGLSGKVVEHTSGYRGRAAEVVAVGLVAAGRWMVTDDPGRVAAVFHDPLAAARQWGEPVGSPITPWRTIVEFVLAREQRDREGGPWTSVNSSV